jgi:hypothetical protein
MLETPQRLHPCPRSGRVPRVGARSLREGARRLPSVAIAFALLLFAVTGRADEPLPISLDWQRLSEAFRAGGAILAPEPVAPRRGSARAVEGSAWGGADGDAPMAGPDASLVARDWGGPRIFLGHLSPTDRIRLSHSSRMLVGRVRLPAGRVIPFAQLGLGQWRLDSDLLPNRREVAYAAQLGYGFELALSRFAAIAFEADYTALYRDAPCPRRSNPSDLWGGFIAARATF